MSDFQSVFAEDEGEWAPLNPKPADTRVIQRLPYGSVRDDEVGPGISPRKLAGIGIKVYRSTGQNIADVTTTSITYDTVVFNESFADPGASITDVVVPYSGVYMIVSQVEWEANATNRRQSWVTVNGTAKEGDTRNGTAGQLTRVALPSIRRLEAGDTIGTDVRQNSTVTLTISAGEDNNSLSIVFLFPI